MTKNTNSCLQLRPYRTTDRTCIAAWPEYDGEFAKLDYALRQGGWIDEYQNKPRTWIYSVERNDDVVGFSILSITDADEAEFRIAIRPGLTGHGLGKHVAEETLSKGFNELGLKRIHLIVRKNNLRAIALYLKLGFTRCGEQELFINCKHEEFIFMEKRPIWSFISSLRREEETS